MDASTHQARVTPPSLTAHLDAFERVGLADLGAAGLMRREDTKFVLAAARLPAVLAGMEGAYRLLAVADRVEHDYLTLYFDTAGLDLFSAHHRGAGERVKVRERKYLTTDQLFLEVKHRSRKGVTIKTRSETSGWLERVDPGTPAVEGRLPGGCRGARLEPVVFNAYRRVTLVALGRPERVTIDTALTFEAVSGSVSLEGVAVIEVKQERIDRSAPVMGRLRALGVRPLGFSKYCVGVSLLVPSVKHNRFKPRLRALARVMRGGAHAA